MSSLDPQEYLEAALDHVEDAFVDQHIICLVVWNPTRNPPNTLPNNWNRSAINTRTRISGIPILS